MNGYSSYDNYFGLNQSNCIGANYGGYGTNIRPNGIGKIPGINAKKETNTNAIGVVAGLAAAVATGVLLFKGKGKIAAAFKDGGILKGIKKLGLEMKDAFTSKVAPKTAEVKDGAKGIISKIKTAFPLKGKKTATAATEVVTDAVADSKTKVADLIKEMKTATPEERKTILKKIQRFKAIMDKTPGVKDTDKVGDVLNSLSKA
ncbi:MAG: hypothetical protein PHV37_02100 [Candidatus Gastranaerophilales bacterium]|nr:hypothetical protein [Candidatus Gastranaerophilales bacterium]